jgi:hypothetical protein
LSVISFFIAFINTALATVRAKVDTQVKTYLTVGSNYPVWCTDLLKT